MFIPIVRVHWVTKECSETLSSWIVNRENRSSIATGKTYWPCDCSSTSLEKCPIMGSSELRPKLLWHISTCPANHGNKSAHVASNSHYPSTSPNRHVWPVDRITTAKKKCVGVYNCIHIGYIKLKLVSRGRDDLFFWCFVGYILRRVVRPCFIVTRECFTLWSAL